MMPEVGHVACCHWCLNRARTGSGGSGHGTKALRVAADGHRGSSERRGNGRRGLQRVQERTCLFDGCHAVRSLHIGGLGAQVSHTAVRMLCIWGPSEFTHGAQRPGMPLPLLTRVARPPSPRLRRPWEHASRRRAPLPSPSSNASGVTPTARTAQRLS